MGDKGAQEVEEKHEKLYWGCKFLTKQPSCRYAGGGVETRRLWQEWVTQDVGESRPQNRSQWLNPGQSPFNSLMVTSWH